MKVALIHDWLNGMRGGEKVLEQLCRLFPDAVIHTLLHEPGKISATINRHRIITSFVQSLPLARAHYRWYLPLFPSAVERFDLSGYDLVVSNSHCCALGARARAAHLCYCLTPMRYAWEHFDLYFPRERFNPLLRSLIGLALARLRRWDRSAAQRVTRFVGDSQNVARRISSYYGREAHALFPPVDTEFYTPAGAKGDFHLVVSALVPYKRVDLAVGVLTQLGQRLVVIGEGPEKRRLMAMAGPKVSFLGWQPDEAVREHYRAARTFIFPGLEDAGITPLEASACGTPTVAYRAGGALETVREGLNGVFFDPQTPEALAAALRCASEGSFDPDLMHRHAETFSQEQFRRRFMEHVEAVAGARPGEWR